MFNFHRTSTPPTATTTTSATTAHAKPVTHPATPAKTPPPLQSPTTNTTPTSTSTISATASPVLLKQVAVPPPNTATATATKKIELTPTQIIELFNARKQLPENSKIPDHIVGRFARGRKSMAANAMLSDEPFKKLCWVFGKDSIEGILGKTPIEAMISAGFSKLWLRNWLSDGEQHRLILMPSPKEECVPGTWDHIMDLIRKHYGLHLWEKLYPFLEELKTTHIKDIDPTGRLRYIAELSTKDRYAHDEYYTPEKLMGLKQEVTLYDARGFMFHTIGCSQLFIGRGYARDPNGSTDRVEYLIPNRKFGSIPGLVQQEFSISANEIHGLHLGKVLSKHERCVALAKIFSERKALRPDSTVAEGIVGRFIRGFKPEHFEKLVGEPSSNLAFVFGGDTIKSFMGLTASCAMMSLGFTKESLVAMNQMKMTHKLVLFPEPPKQCRKAKWDDAMELVKLYYEPEVYKKVAPHLKELKAKEYSEIDPNFALREVANYDYATRISHPNYYSAAKIKALPKVELFHARGFFYHSIRCNELFEGIGYTRSRDGDDDRAEYLVENMIIKNIPDVV
ncbi:hypothetical protein HK100_006256, partial [Physocladia obscura]